MKVFEGFLVKIANGKWALARATSASSTISSQDSGDVRSEIPLGSYFGMQSLCASADRREAECSVQAAVLSYVFALRREAFYEATTAVPEWTRFMEFVRGEVDAFNGGST